MKTADEIAVISWWMPGTVEEWVEQKRVLFEAYTAEREAREKAEAERDAVIRNLGELGRRRVSAEARASRIERETIERCIALIAGMFTRAPEVVAEIEARLRAMGDKP